ncbi:MAG: hypothetical protein HRJ53_25770, partial [Acidobacteria bacterium Pan2503]|nr:hypothetical protein [Candidatus Acidoferrum panamensis]
AMIGQSNALSSGILGQGQASQGLYQNLAAIPGMMSGFYQPSTPSTPFNPYTSNDPVALN